MVETGLFYGVVIDPILKSTRTKLAAQIKGGETVIDIACGTGAQVFEMAGKTKRVVGIDLSESMIKYARKQSDKLESKNVEFVLADATNLSDFADNEFDVASMSLALHQFPPELYSPILNEMKRVAKRVVIVDYAVPLPNSLVGFVCKSIEFMAGIEHNRCFRKFCKNGGLKTILANNNMEVKSIKTFAGAAFVLVQCNVE